MFSGYFGKFGSLQDLRALDVNYIMKGATADYLVGAAVISVVFDGDAWISGKSAPYVLDPVSGIYSEPMSYIKTLKSTTRPMVLFVGDSITAGKDGGGSTLNAGSWVEKSVAIINTNGRADISTAGIVCPISNLSVTSNTQWTVAGWSRAGFGAAGNACYTRTVGDSGTGTLGMTPRVANRAYDVIRVMVICNDTLGTLVLTPSDGAPAVTIDCAAYPVGVRWIDVPLALPSTTASVVATVTSGSVFIVGFGAYDSTDKAILFANAGISGSDTSHWSLTTAFKSLDFISRANPSHSIVSLGRNDVINGITPEAYKANLDAIVAHCLKYGTVEIASMVPTSSASGSHDPEYLNAMQAVARARGCGYIPFWEEVYGGQFQSALMENSVHPNAAGYDAMAAFYASHW